MPNVSWDGPALLAWILRVARLRCPSARPRRALCSTRLCGWNTWTRVATARPWCHRHAVLGYWDRRTPCYALCPRIVYS
eukprot:733448-Lingulodinium_polyedra.AAC.1